MSAPLESTYASFLTGGDREIRYERGPKLPFASAKINLTLPTDLSSGISPELFKLTWKVPEASQLTHRLDRVDFSYLKARFVLVLPGSEPLIGSEGQVPLSKYVDATLVNWIKTTSAGNITATFVFRPLSSASNGANTAGNALGAITQHAQNDVLLLFPSRDKTSPPRTLWARSNTLVKFSPYFKTLLESVGFSETSQKIEAPKFATKSLQAAKPTTTTTVATCGEKEEQVAEESATENDVMEPRDEDLEHEDSDLENDYFPSASSSPSIHRIVIHGVAYKTLLAYLYHLETGTIEFEPLSSLLPASHSPPLLRPSLPPTCSPKSMYRLSSFYEHHTLRELSYNSISSQLDCRNALVELFSDLSADYEEIKALCMQAVLDNWNHVKGSTEMKQIGHDLEKGKLEARKVGLVLELFSKLKPAST